jgi:hypothetical protein
MTGRNPDGTEDFPSPGCSDVAYRKGPMLSYSLGYSPDANGHLPRSQVAVQLVGVAGFEPAASSSAVEWAAVTKRRSASSGLLPRD